MTTKLNHWIDGRAVEPASGEYIDCVNPGTGGPAASIAAGSAADVDAAVAAAVKAAWAWRKTPAETRTKLLMKLAAAMRADKERIARLEVEDTGKLFDVAVGEVVHSASFFDY